MIGPKEKKERALGEHLHLKGARCQSPKCAMVRKPYPPGMHGKKRTGRGLSDFGRQLLEKQRVKISYGIDERALRGLFYKAQRKTGSTALGLFGMLEMRLDNVIFRLGLAPSRGAARQLITHGHILVGGKRVRSPGYITRPNDVIALRPESASQKTFENLREALKKYEAPSWLHLDLEKLEGRVVSPPTDTSTPFEFNLLVESFSK
ncbi:MAG: 30S ribosomal protein S4 [Parcubacteria group bacterium GW2011_GWB1_56_8]|nr:MAG: 30S ribosomal protein S4 [Parcubacteria group bacterium GW2011_GWB1_56_8]